MSEMKQVGFLSFFILLIQCTKPSLSQANCLDVMCKPLENCILEVMEEGSCCPSCAQFGCPCEGYQYYDCLSVGFQGGKVPEGESYFVDFGSTECTCPSGGGRISCHFIPCPELPPNCIDIMQPADGCVQCGRIGCIHGEEKYEAGHTFHMSHCKFCHCPNTGGELMCYAVPDCDMEADNNTHLMDTTESDPERQYDYPYSHEQDPLEIVEKNNNYKRNALQDHSKLDYEDVTDEEVTTLSTTTQVINLVEYTTTQYSTHPTTQPSTMAYTTDSSTTIAPLTSTESKVTAKTTIQPDVIEATTSQATTTQLRTTEENKASSIENSTEKGKSLEIDPQINKTQDLDPAVNKDDYPEEEKEENVFSTTVKAIVTSVQWSPSPSVEPQVTFPRLGEQGAPKDILNQSRTHDGSSKELIETCCTAGQQWSIDHGECENMAHSASKDCRLVEKQCCISYIKDNTCIAGMIAAKEDGICLQTENDHCERSQFKLCCDCCSLGLKIRKEGHSCESNLNLGYPCNHMMMLCCNGEEQLLPPEIKILPKPQPTPKAEKDMDECALNTHTCKTGERFVNTVGSFTCVSEVTCETGFILEEGVCQDINECSSSPAPCKQGFTCINTLGSYVCQRKHLNCNRGYKSNENGTMCIDIDECAKGVHNCSSEQACYNLPGSYRCDCKAGYRFDTFRRKCLDVNECWVYPGRMCHHTCENTVGSYRCSCFAGFRLSQDGKHCEDVNECEQNPCNQECTNIYGSYQCYCKEGYKLGDDGTTCEDIDECRQSIGSICTFACVNTPGSYQCACPEHGYTMSVNGLTCKDIDECEIGTHNCTSSEECYNIQGSHKCLSFDCPENYRRVSNMQCERHNCFNYQDCQNTPFRISYHRLNFPTGVVVPAQIFRISPSPAYAGDNIIMDIKKGNEENYFSVRKLNPYTGILYLQRPLRKPKDFLLDVEMKLYRQGSVTTFLSRIYIFITAPVS
ncbi:fibulin-2-like [Hyla sarda]|uniref:fibulin-2-like n=1 Tax=Hyla sarda TaxID=327740 RepID=UPI0024C38FDB|nr:fibulin-2-like [Hyla sarda]XP_056381034.1 fibulin-2-like [Hyla sarda]